MWPVLTPSCMRATAEKLSLHGYGCTVAVAVRYDFGTAKLFSFFLIYIKHWFTEQTAFFKL